jgi:mono/diheme cytochrome c family protein
MGGEPEANKMNIINRARMTWAAMPAWALIADVLIIGGLIAATAWLLTS